MNLQIAEVGGLIREFRAQIPPSLSLLTFESLPAKGITTLESYPIVSRKMGLVQAKQSATVFNRFNKWSSTNGWATYYTAGTSSGRGEPSEEKKKT